MLWQRQFIIVGFSASGMVRCRKSCSQQRDTLAYLAKIASNFYQFACSDEDNYSVDEHLHGLEGVSIYGSVRSFRHRWVNCTVSNSAAILFQANTWVKNRLFGPALVFAAWIICCVSAT